MKLWRKLIFLMGIIDILNYFYIWKIIRNNKNTDRWNMFGIDHDWVGRIYFLYSISEEDDGESEPVKRTIVTNGISPAILYLEELGLNEVVSVDISRINNSITYLIKCSPLFYIIDTVKYQFSIAAIVALYLFGYFEMLFNYIKTL